MKKLIVVLIFGIAAGFISFTEACRREPQAGSTPPPVRRRPKVTVAPVTAGPLAWEIETVGTFEAQEEISVAAGVAGVVTKVLFKEGDRATPDTVLCTIDEERFRLEADRARAEKARAEADLVRARNAYQQRLPLYEKKYITEEELADLKAAVDRAVAEVDRAQAALALAEKALRDSSVRPPVAGVINSKNISTGEYAKAETVVATLVDLSSLHLRFAVPETESAHLQPGARLTFTSRLLGSTPMDAEVYWVSQTADPRTRSVECKARVVDPPAALRPGFSGTVKVVLEHKEGAILIPSGAVLPTEKGFIAFVLEGATARERRLHLGVRTLDDRVEVLDGLAEGETLVVRGGSILRDGAEVEVVP